MCFFGGNVVFVGVVGIVVNLFFMDVGEFCGLFVFVGCCVSVDYG